MSGFSALEFFFRIKRKGLKTEGTIVRIDTTIWGVRPLISFKDREGNEMEAMAKNVKRGKNTTYREGDKVVIFYMTNDPETCVIDAHIWAIILAVLITTIGAGIFLTTIFSLILD